MSERLQDKYYPAGYRHMEDHELSVRGECMCCLNTNIVPSGWQQLTDVFGVTGQHLRKNWPNYTFATKIKEPPPPTPIFNERILSRKTIESWHDCERVPALTSDEQRMLVAALVKCGALVIEWESY